MHSFSELVIGDVFVAPFIAYAVTALAIVPALSVGSAFAQDGSVSLSPAALREIAQVEAEIDRIEAQALERLSAPPNNQVQQIELLGKEVISRFPS